MQKWPDFRATLYETGWVQMLPSAARERVVAEAHFKAYGAHESVAHKGDPSDAWFGVAEGLVKVSTVATGGRSVMFTAVPAGSWVGEGSVIKREARRYDLLALRPTMVIHIPQSTFMWLLETSIEFSRFIINHLNERTGQFVGMMELSRLSDPTARVAGAICNLFNPVLYPNSGPVLRISQEEIGALAGLARPTANAAVTRLKQMNFVRPQYGGLLILDIEGLRRLAYDLEEVEGALEAAR